MIEALLQRVPWLAKIPTTTVREFAVIATGQVLAALGGFVGFRLLSGHITTSVWGEVLLWQTFALLANQVLVAGLAGAASRHAIAAERAGELAALLVAVGGLMAAAFAVIVVLLALSTLAGLTPELAGNLPVLGIVLLLSIVVGITSVADSLQNAFRQRVVVALHQSAGQWLRFLLALALVVGVATTAESVLAGFAGAALIVLASQIGFALRLFRLINASFSPAIFARSRHWAGEVLRYGWPFAAWGVLNWLQTSVERWVIEGTLNASELGVYGAASQLSIFPLTMFWSALMQLLAPIAYRTADAEANPARARRIILAAAVTTGGLGGVLALVAALFGERLAGFFVAAHFHEMVHYWPAMLLVGGLSGAAQVLSVAGMVGKRTDLLIFPRIASGVTGIALLLLLVPRLGLNGAVLASGITAVVLLLMNVRLYFRLGHVV
jgi:O-antigen/teichoic acid export membrane protein